MRAQTPAERDEFMQHMRRVSYRWSLADGTICHNSTVVMSSTKDGLRKAVKRFWNTNKQVQPEVA